MPNDYHIYIHSDNVENDNTKPYQNKENDSDSDFSVFQAAKVIKGGAEGVINTGVASLSKALPPIAIAVAVAKTSIHVLKTGFAHEEEYTGRYENNVAFNNFFSVVNATLHPISTALNIAHREAQYNKQNLAIKQQNTLYGNSVLKDMKVGV